MTTKVTELMLDNDSRTSKLSLRIKLPASVAIETWPVDIIPLDKYRITQIVAQTDEPTSTVDFEIEINGVAVQWTTAAGPTIQATSGGVTDTPLSDFIANPSTLKPVEILVDMNTAMNAPVWLFVELFYVVIE